VVIQLEAALEGNKTRKSPAAPAIQTLQDRPGSAWGDAEAIALARVPV